MRPHSFGHFLSDCSFLLVELFLGLQSSDLGLHFDELNILLGDEFVDVVGVVGADGCFVLALAVLALPEFLGAQGGEGFQEEPAVFQEDEGISVVVDGEGEAVAHPKAVALVGRLGHCLRLCAYLLVLVLEGLALMAKVGVEGINDVFEVALDLAGHSFDQLAALTRLLLLAGS